ncbi:eukaryotic translation initiation factor 5a [Anaeramoeba flamelloides]|uniref:Eukaryotic translation initiation factor 5a n=1 Tax=Anaeramoeba flamelloides TaxID=1746091 RepID=A0AAV7ZRQ9_9EUKA|nr:eukaryotic translation initiation factor 5a [Anaeramoeba flamelloides]
MEFKQKELRFFSVGEIIKIQDKLHTICSIKSYKTGKHGNLKCMFIVKDIMTCQKSQKMEKSTMVYDHLECKKENYIVYDIDAEYVYLQGKDSEIERRQLPPQYNYDSVFSKLKKGRTIKMAEYKHKDQIVCLLIQD